MKKELIESISKMIVIGKRLELPQDEHFDNYAQVKKCLLLAGGKYKKCGFEFVENAQEIKDRLIGGEAIDDKKKFQFFATPDALARRLVDMADVTDNCRVLEPSAGQGAISNLVRDLTDECIVVELMPQNAKALRRQEYDVKECDFLTLKIADIGMFDRIIANPPFTKNQDIDHIIHMMTLLKPGGKLVSVASQSWTFGSQKKQLAFRDWLDVLNAKITELDAGEFKTSGTNISAVIVEITLPVDPKHKLNPENKGYVKVPASSPSKKLEKMMKKMKKKNAGNDIKRFKCERNREITDAVIERRAKSIKANGLINPITVQSCTDNKKYDYKVVAGRIRFFALKKLKIKELAEGPDFLVKDDVDADLISYVENDERKDLSLIEQVDALTKLRATRSIKELAHELGRTEKWVALRVNLGNLSDKWQEALRDDKYPALRVGHYEVIAKYSENVQNDILDSYLTNGQFTIAEFAKRIKNQYSHLIYEAPWPIDICINCPKRSQAQEWLFDDMGNSNMDHCLDDQCWQSNLKRCLSKEIKKIENRKPNETKIYLISDDYYTEKTGVLTNNKYTIDRDSLGEDFNAFNVDTCEYLHIMINSSGSSGNASINNKPKTLQERLDELKHKREKVAVQAVIDIVKKEPPYSYTVPDHHTIYWLGALLAPNSIGSYYDEEEDISYDLGKSWPKLETMPLDELDARYWRRLVEKITETMAQEINGTLDTIKTLRTVIICQLLKIDWAAILDEAVLSINEPKTLTKMLADERVDQKRKDEADMDQMEDEGMNGDGPAL
jgi:ParB/RepB/Spo0J family partition protein